MSNIKEVVNAAYGRQMLKLIKRYRFGAERKYCTFEPEPIELADRPALKGETYYYYDGPMDKKNRPFCHDMLTLDKVFSEKQIQFLSDELGYDVLKYKGSYGCRHSWILFRGKVIYTPPPTPNQMRNLTAEGQPFYDPYVNNPRTFTNYY